MNSGGGTTTQSSSPYAAPLFGLGVSQERSTLPILQQLSSAISEALRTGGIGAQQPIANRAQDAARSAFSSAQTQTAENLAQQNVGGSTAEQILGGQRMQAGEQIAGIPTDIAQNFIGMAPGVASESGAGPMGAAGRLTTSTTATPGFWDMFSQGLGSFTSGAGLVGGLGFSNWMWPKSAVAGATP